MLKNISIRGAREHNLKNVDVEIPRDTLTVLTGLSGSGKSSLAFDTIYAEGQRRYVESLSAYARQFLELMQKPDVDHIEGLSPAISIEQKTTSQESALDRRHRHRDLRLSAPAVRAGGRALFARHRPSHRKPDRQPDGRPHPGAARRHAALSCWRPSCAAARANTARNWPSCRRRASSAPRWTANSTKSAPRPALDKKLKHDIEIVVDRIVVKPDIGNRLPDSIETALSLADGLVDRRIRRREGKRRQARSRSCCLVQIRLPGFRLHHPRDRAAAVLLQQSAWRLPGMRRARACRIISTKRWWCPTRALTLRKGAIAPWAKNRPRPIICRRWRRWRGTTNSR